MKFINFLISTISIGLGFVYIFDLYGIRGPEIDRSILFWGILSICLGSIHFLITIVLLILKKENKILKIINIFLISIIQFVPIILFIGFDNMMVVEYPEYPDGDVSGVAHCYYAIPHSIIILLFIIFTILTFKKISNKNLV